MDDAQIRTTTMQGRDNGRPDRIPFGIPGLDDVLLGGLPAGHLYLIEGTPGAGKTTIALRFVLNALESGINALYITLSESRNELSIVATSHGWQLDGLEVFELTPQEDTLRADQQYSIFNPEDVELNQLTDLIAKKVGDVQPDVIVVDSLSELRLLARDSFRYRRQMLALKSFFEERKCTVLMIDNYIGERKDQRELQLQSIVHGVIMLEMLDREYGSQRRRLRVQKIRGSQFREGFHDYRIMRGGVVVLPRLVAAEHRQVHRHAILSTGIPQLDAMLKGGISSGTSTLMLGAAGVGKSSLSACFACSALKRGDSAAIYIFDETEQVYLERSARLGLNLKPYIESGQLHLQQLDPAEVPPGEFVNDIRTRVCDQGISVVIIDSLNGLLNAMPGELYLQLQMHELLTFLNMQGVATFMILAQHGVVGSMESDVNLSYLADGIILLRYFEVAGAIKKAISVFKKRSGPHESTIRELRLEDGQILVSEPLNSFHGVLTGVPQFLSTQTYDPATADAD